MPYVYAPGSVPVAPAIVTFTVTAPALCAGVVQVIVVSLTTVMFVAALVSNVTAAPAAKPKPWSVTAAPPPIGPEEGSTRVTVGLTTMPDCMPVRLLAASVAVMFFGGLPALFSVTLKVCTPLSLPLPVVKV